MADQGYPAKKVSDWSVGSQMAANDNEVEATFGRIQVAPRRPQLIPPSYHDYVKLLASNLEQKDSLATFRPSSIKVQHVSPTPTSSPHQPTELSAERRK